VNGCAGAVYAAAQSVLEGSFASGIATNYSQVHTLSINSYIETVVNKL